MPRLTSATLLFVVICGTLLPACQPDPPPPPDELAYWRALAQKSNSGSGWQVQGGSSAQGPGQHFTDAPQGNGYAILLKTFTGEHADRDSQRLVRTLRAQSVLPDVRVYPDGGRVQVQRGRYSSPNDPMALNDLHQTRLVQLNGERPFADAQIVAFGGQNKPVVSPADLRQYAGVDGYTLQVAFFDPAGGPNYREAAEAYCRQLLQQHEQAYFYHGQSLSLVTVGLFGDADLVKVGAGTGYGPKIKEVQQRFPYNLGNGATIIEKKNGKVIRTQPSFLVRLPEN